MTTDTQIRHVTNPGANLFLELGFAPDEAKRFQAESKQQINDTKALKNQPAKDSHPCPENSHPLSENSQSLLTAVPCA